MTGPSRKQRELALRQEIVFEAAEAVLAERGFHRASVDEVAKRAEVSVGTLYNLFGSKENLYLSLLNRGIDQVCDRVREYTTSAPTGIAKLHAAIDAIFAHCGEHERAFRVFVAASHGLEQKLPQPGEHASRHMQALYADLGALCRLAIREGSLPRLNPDLLALSLVSTINSFVTHWAARRPARLSDYQEEAHTLLRALSTDRARREVTPLRRLRSPKDP